MDDRDVKIVRAIFGAFAVIAVMGFGSGIFENYLTSQETIAKIEHGCEEQEKK